ncbi:MAG: FecR domain-containing protein [Pseudomonadota bacterium]
MIGQIERTLIDTNGNAAMIVRMKHDLNRATIAVARFGWVLMASVVILAHSGSDAQSEVIGETITTERIVVGTPPDASRHRKKSRDPIVRDEVIETGAASTGQFQFRDETNLAIGPNTRLTLNTAVFSGDRHNELVRGTLRFVTDRVSRGRDLNISTPFATIGVRGTAYDVHVDPATGETTVLLVRGGPVDVCVRGGTRCVVLRSLCDCVRIGPQGPSAPQPVNELFDAGEARALFPFAARSARTRPVFRRGVSDCGIRAGRNFVTPLERRGKEDRDRSDDDDVSSSTPSAPASSTPNPNTPNPNTPGPNAPAPNTPGTPPGPNTPGPNTPGPNTPGPNTPGPNTPGPNTPGPNTPGPNTPGTPPGPNNT